MKQTRRGDGVSVSMAAVRRECNVWIWRGPMRAVTAAVDAFQIFTLRPLWQKETEPNLSKGPWTAGLIAQSDFAPCCAIWAALVLRYHQCSSRFTCFLKPASFLGFVLSDFCFSKRENIIRWLLTQPDVKPLPVSAWWLKPSTGLNAGIICGPFSAVMILVWTLSRSRGAAVLMESFLLYIAPLK